MQECPSGSSDFVLDFYVDLLYGKYMKKIAAILIFLFASTAYAEVIHLKEGVNQIDLDGDGVKDLIIKTDRFNGTAHSYIAYSFALKRGEKYEDIMLEDKYGATETPGADCQESVLRIERDGGGFFLVRINLRPIDFSKGETWWMPREAYKKKYKLVPDDGGEHRWEKTEEQFIPGENCELERLF
jgi:hypothetical protein